MENNKLETIKNEIATPQEQTTGLLAMIERVAMNPQADIEKMKALMVMRNEVVADERRQAFAKDFVDMKPHLPAVIRTKRNEQTKSNYAPLEEVNQTVDPILEKYGFATATKITSQTPDSVTVEAELWHKGGHVEKTSITMPLDNKGSQGTVNKTLPHATRSSVTYARNTAICALLNISTENEDNDGNNVIENLATAPQQKAIKELFDKLTPAQQSAFKNACGEVEEVKSKDVDKVIAKLKRSVNAGNN